MNSKDYQRSPALILVMSLFILVALYRITLNIFSIVNRQLLMFDYNLGYYYYLPHIDRHTVFTPSSFSNVLVVIINVTEIAFGIFLLCVCMAKLKNWSFKAYVVLTGAETVMQIINTIINIVETSKVVTGFEFSIFSYQYIIFEDLSPFAIRGVLLFIVYLFVIKNPPLLTDGKYIPHKSKT
jgi:hypothetical protein